MICECGLQIDFIIYPEARIRELDENGEVIYEVCMHGITVIDERKDKEYV